MTARAIILKVIQLQVELETGIEAELKTISSQLRCIRSQGEVPEGWKLKESVLVKQQAFIRKFIDLKEEEL